MTPKEKAKELIDNFANAQSEDGFVNTNKYRHKQCALIAVNEIIKALRKDLPEIGLGKGYWYRVRQEIENI
jgi:hypothetical protein